MLYGRVSSNIPSRFIYEMGEDVLDEIKTKVKLNTYNKIENLYLRFKNYLN